MDLMDANLKILQSYLELQEDKLYFNQIKEQSKLSHSSLQNSLKKLVEKKLLALEKTKGHSFYRLHNKQLLSIEFAKLSQNRFENLNLNVKVPLRNLRDLLPVTIFTVILFGSVAQKQERKGSDIDILLVSQEKINTKQIQEKINMTAKYPLSIFTCTPEQFIAKKDPVIIQARKTGFPIYKEQNFYEVKLNEYQ